MRRFLQAYGSPLADYAKDFITISEDTNTDWALLPAVAGAESTFGRHECGSHNAWGYGQPCWDFTDYPTAIRAVTNTISTSPTYRGYQKNHDLVSLARVYNGADTKKWVKTVSYFQERLRAFR